MKLFRSIDTLISDTTMYRLLVYGLGTLAALALLFSFTGTTMLSGKGMVVSLVTLVSVCYAVNWVLSRVWRVAANTESSLITALILFCILPQATTMTRFIGVLLAGLIAIASKYLVAWQGKHVFNPAAFGAVAVNLLGIVGTTWWVGSTAMLPFTAILAVLILRKVRKFQVFGCFAAASLLAVVLLALSRDQAISTALSQAVTSSPLIFLGSIMLIEPATMPWRTNPQLLYGLLVGALAAGQLSVGDNFITPGIALCFGNLFAYALSPKYDLRLRLQQKNQLSEHIYEYIFTPNRKLNFLPGQYLAWTLPHAHPDSRGNRRTFTIASSPTEPDLYLAVKFYEPPSSFKTALKAMEPGSFLTASQLGGNFVLPKNTHDKLVFIAGGIGITPFRSMVKYLVDTKQRRDITLFYLVSDPAELSFPELWQTAAPNGVRTIPVLGAQTIPSGWTGLTGRLDPEIIKREIPDYKERTFYISGPPPMVKAYIANLRKLGIPRRRIHTDYFAGY